MPGFGALRQGVRRPANTFWNATEATEVVVEVPAGGPPRSPRDSVQSSATAVPPSLLTTYLTSFRCGVLSVLMIVQVTWPRAATVTTVLAAFRVPPGQLHSPVEE